MRYVRLKTTVSKVVDETIDIPTAKTVIKTLCDKEMTCSLQLSDGPRMEPVRITKVTDKDFMFHKWSHSGLLRRTVSYDEVIYLEVNTKDEVLARVKCVGSRWMLLDPSASFPDSTEPEPV